MQGLYVMKLVRSFCRSSDEARGAFSILKLICFDLHKDVILMPRFENW